MDNFNQMLGYMFHQQNKFGLYVLTNNKKNRGFFVLKKIFPELARIKVLGVYLDGVKMR